MDPLNWTEQNRLEMCTQIVKTEVHSFIPARGPSPSTLSTVLTLMAKHYTLVVNHLHRFLRFPQLLENNYDFIYFALQYFITFNAMCIRNVFVVNK